MNNIFAVTFIYNIISQAAATAEGQLADPPPPTLPPIQLEFQCRYEIVRQACDSVSWLKQRNE